MDRHPGRLMLELSWLLEAAPERVFRLLAEPTELAKWWGPAGFTTPLVDWRPKKDGWYRLGMQPPDGRLFHLTGQFLEVRPPRWLVFSFRWEEPDPDDVPTVVTLALAAVGDATKLSLTQGDFATEARLALHRSGWSDSIDKLRELIGSRS